MQDQKPACCQRNLLILLLMAVALASSCGGGSAAAPAPGTSDTPVSLLLNTTSLDFGNVAVGASKTNSITLSNPGSAGGPSITVSQITVAGTGFHASLPAFPLVITAGQAFTLNLTFTPKTAGAATGDVTILVDGDNQPVAVPLTGNGTAPGQLAVNPTSLSFGNVSVGSSKSSSITLTNSAQSGGQSISITQISVGGSPFSVVLPNLPLTLSAGQSYVLSVSFSPVAAGTFSDNVVIDVSGSTSTSVPLSGIGLAPGQLGVSPATLSFGNVNVGSNLSKTGTLTAGNANITVSSAAWTGQGYSLSGITFPVTILAGQSVNYTVSFAPQTAGASNGNVSFVSDASNSPTVQTFSGTGVQPVQHSATLTWNASASQVVGYYIYRSTQSGSYTTPLNQAPEPSLTYVDNSVGSGTTYYYVITAVDSNSQQSNYSNEVVAVIPQ